MNIIIQVFRQVFFRINSILSNTILSLKEIDEDSENFECNEVIVVHEKNEDKKIKDYIINKIKNGVKVKFSEIPPDFIGGPINSIIFQNAFLFIQMNLQVLHFFVMDNFKVKEDLEMILIEIKSINDICAIASLSSKHKNVLIWLGFKINKRKLMISQILT